MSKTPSTNRVQSRKQTTYPIASEKTSTVRAPKLSAHDLERAKKWRVAALLRPPRHRKHGIY